MSATSSQKSASASLQRPVSTATRKYLAQFTETISRRGDGVTDEDIWTASEYLKVPYTTAKVCDLESDLYVEILTDIDMAGS
jgi:hypothetical protein